MNEFDEKGWSQIHHAAFRGFVKSIKNFVSTNTDQLELETQDDLHSSPLLIAVMAGQEDAVKCLLQLGARVNAVNSQSHGIVELAALKQNISMIKFFLDKNVFEQNKMNKKSSTVLWQNLLKLLCSPDDEESENAGSCLRILLDPGDEYEPGVKESDNEGLNVYWTDVIDQGLIPSVIQVIKSDLNEAAKTQAFLTLLHLMHLSRVREQFVKNGGVAALVPLLRSESVQLVVLSARILGGMAHGAQEHARTMVQAGLLPSLVKVLEKWSTMPVVDNLHSLSSLLTVKENTHDFDSQDAESTKSPISLLTRRQKDELIKEVVQTLGIVCENNNTHQLAASHEPDCFKLLVSLFNDCVYKGLLMALTITITSLVTQCDTNQNLMLDADVGTHLITLVRVKDNALQLSAVEAINALVENNSQAQHRVLAQNVTAPLLAILRRNRGASNIREATAKALWSLAGYNAEERRKMANAIGVAMLVEFLQSQSVSLHLIGCEALSVLAQGPSSQSVVIGQQGGIQGLVTLLRSDKESVVTKSLIALRHASLGIAYQPNVKNQNMIVNIRGIRFLVALMVYAKDDIIRAEAACTLAAVSLGNATVLSEIQSHPEFSYIRVLKMLHNENGIVKTLAGNALATFAYNSASNQREIAINGGIPFSCLLSMLRSTDEEERCQASFQVVILARIIPDEEQAISSAAGIKLLIDLIYECDDHEVQALAADCVARLAHTRVGIPQAMVSIGVVEGLCNLLRSKSENVRGSAAVALCFLSFNADARRRILNQCRRDPILMEVIQRYQASARGDPKFREGWQHIKRVGLPAIDKGRTQLTVSKSLDFFKDPGNRQLTMFSVDDDPISTTIPQPLTSNNKKQQATSFIPIVGNELAPSILKPSDSFDLMDSIDDNNKSQITVTNKDELTPEGNMSQKKRRETARVSFADKVELNTTIMENDEEANEEKLIV